MKNSIIASIVVSLFWIAYIKGVRDQEKEDTSVISNLVKEIGQLEQEIESVKSKCSHRRVDERNRT